MYFMWKYLVIMFYIRHAKPEQSKKIELLRQRVMRIETRLSEDIASIREEFYDELKDLSAMDNTDESFETHANEKSLKGSESELDLELFESELTNKFKTLQHGILSEKRIRREIQKEVQIIKDKDIDVVKSIETMIQNSTANMNNIATMLDVRNELSEVISILKNLTRIGLQTSGYERIFPKFASSCMELRLNGHITSGTYTVFPNTIWRPLNVFCDMETSGGGWTVFQRRNDGSENFFRQWLDYSFGFGNISGEFWLGNEFIFRLTHEVPHELMIELEDFDNDCRVAKYGLFSIGNADKGYLLSISDFEGNVTDSFGNAHNGMKFSTTDKGPSQGCAKSYKGGWWYGNCHAVNINGLYLKGKHESYADGINWLGWLGHHYSLKRTEMKFRPK